ncbi:MAG TPA: TlyA family RNA methyltransferase [Actinomycetota bacterium]|nr:TlyA family RNA methyltransferase [Actinomycetota bacterium]
MRTARLDTELVRRGLSSSRTEAQRAIDEGKVTVKGLPATRAATLVSPNDPIVLTGDAKRFVGRGGDKLDGALARLDVRVSGRRWFDLGASTGGFTDRLLQGGASAVCAIDVGYGQLAWSLRNDERVVVMERRNVRDLTAEDVPWPADGVVADLSFISTTLVFPAIHRIASADADLVVLVKPQFEVGRSEVGKGGVVRDPALWRAALERSVTGAAAEGFGLVDAVPSPLPGPAGNREFFLHLRAGGGASTEVLDRAVAEVTT